MTWPADPKFRMTRHAMERFRSRIERVYRDQCPDGTPSVSEWITTIAAHAYKHGRRQIGVEKMQVSAHGFAFVLAKDTRRPASLSIVTILPIDQPRLPFTALRKRSGHKGGGA